jgi:hypothetical protein
MIQARDRALYLGWIGANCLGEVVGLGATFAIGYILFSRFEPANTWQIILQALLMTSSGLLEGAVVGTFQWFALRDYLPIQRRAWVWATIIGAVFAWAAGSLPMTLASLGSQASGEAAAEPAGWIMLLLEIGLGLVAGAILSLAQMVVLRKVVRRAGWWVLANGVAWALGMPIIFAAADLAASVGPIAVTIEIMVFALALTGAVVGTIHGLGLVRLARNSQIVSGLTQE